MPAALLPAALPNSKPVPAPIAAPGPARPVTEPIAAPAAAPITVPATALAVAASAAACPALPVICCAYWLQAKPSAWNSSKLLFVPGRTMTLGPLGTVTQALSSAVPQSTPARARRDVEVLIWLSFGCIRLRFSYRVLGRGPASGTTFSQPLGQL